MKEAPKLDLNSKPTNKNVSQLCESPLVFGQSFQLGADDSVGNRIFRPMFSMDEDQLAVDMPAFITDRVSQLRPSDLASSMLISAPMRPGANDSLLAREYIKESILRIAAAGEDPIVNLSAFDELHTNLKRFAQLFRVLAKLFCGNRVEMDDYALDPMDREVLHAVVQKKFAKKAFRPTGRKSDDEAVEWINRAAQGGSSKRPEECYKFLLTKAFKSLRRRFERLKVEKKLPAEDFDAYYFGATAAELSLPLSFFHYPPVKSTAGAQAFRVDFFKKLFRSARFREDALEFIHNTLWKEYKVKICKKLERLLSERERKIAKSPAAEAAVLQEFRLYLLNNRKCKLPWTIYDVKAAIEKLVLLID